MGDIGHIAVTHLSSTSLMTKHDRSQSSTDLLGWRVPLSFGLSLKVMGTEASPNTASENGFLDEESTAKMRGFIPHSLLSFYKEHREYWKLRDVGSGISFF